MKRKKHPIEPGPIHTDWVKRTDETIARKAAETDTQTQALQADARLAKRNKIKELRQSDVKDLKLVHALSIDLHDFASGSSVPDDLRR